MLKSPSTVVHNKNTISGLCAKKIFGRSGINPAFLERIAESVGPAAPDAREENPARGGKAD